MKTITYRVKDVKLMVDDRDLDEMVAEASVSLNPNVSWMKLVLTDDDYNANKQRIPREEFANVIKTGAFMPLKMAFGEIEDGHEDSYPLGSIAHLKTNGNVIEALVALWKQERPEDIEHLKELHASGKPIDVSWEITYTDSEESKEGETLRGVAMNATTIVGDPAYQGRTTVTALSSKKANNQDGDKLMDTITVEKHEEILSNAKAELQAEVDKTTKALEERQAELDKLKPEHEELKKFKTEVEAEKAEKEKFAAIKKKFADAGLEKLDDEYFDERRESFVAMEDTQLDFVIQELVAAFASNTEEDNEDEDDDAKASVNLTSKGDIPDVKSKAKGKVTADDIVELLNKQDDPEE
jgi:hypothetical protein